MRKYDGEPQKGLLSMVNTAARRLEALNIQLAEILQRANQRTTGPPEKILGLEEIQVLSGLIDQGKQLLEDSLSESDPEWQTQRKAYQENLQEIRDLIQKLESNLNRRREELRAGSAQLRAITDWIEALKRTR
jgi:chromosome segregation ATPase